MKNKCLAVAFAALVGIMSFVPNVTVKAYDTEICRNCGEYCSICEIVGYVDNEVETRVCEHGHEYCTDVLHEHYHIVRNYCADCDESWEEEIFVKAIWQCTYGD